jgi:hypothetical protein
MKPVGLLWDSVSNNIGDQAIGLVLQQFCTQNNIQFRVVNPFQYDTADFSTIIIGGGELLREKGNPFYDSFRVPGKQILNAVGAHHPSDLDYLKDYHKVTVRSKPDKERINELIPSLEVDIVPCTTILVKDLFPNLVDTGPDSKEMIGVHINAAAIKNLPDFISELIKINSLYPIELIPFTLYQNDISLLKMICKYLPNASVYSKYDPLDVLAEIGRMKLMITSSLHATIFSYVNEIPFLAYPVYPKITGFLEERGLESYLFTTSQNLNEKVEQAISNPINYHQALESDKNVLHNHLDAIKQIITSVPDETAHNDNQSSCYTSNRLLHQNELDIVSLTSQLLVEKLDRQIMDARFNKKIDELGGENIALKDEVATYALSTSWRITRPMRKIMDFIKEHLGG